MAHIQEWHQLISCFGLAASRDLVCSFWIEFSPSVYNIADSHMRTKPTDYQSFHLIYCPVLSLLVPFPSSEFCLQNFVEAQAIFKSNFYEGSSKMGSENWIVIRFRNGFFAIHRLWMCFCSGLQSRLRVGTGKLNLPLSGSRVPVILSIVDCLLLV
jgi:hypothetical protein